MLSREGIDKLWMKSKDIYEFARLVEAHTSSTAPKSMSWYMAAYYDGDQIYVSTEEPPANEDKG